MSEELTVRTEELTTRLDAQIGQLTLMISQLTARIAAMEDQSKVTVLHQDALALTRLIRSRARQMADKYNLGPAGERKLRSAIKKDVLIQYGIRDLHDLPARQLAGARMMISSWSSYQVIRGVMLCG